MIKTPDEIRKAGLRALVKELGVAGMIRFMQQFDLGERNYTEDRKAYLDNLTIEEITTSIEENKP